MPAFSKTLSLLLSILSDILQKNDTTETFCNKLTQIEHVHPRFYPILMNCHELLDKQKKEFVKNKDYCTCGEEDCDCTWDF
jgi:hypothetical protein